MSHGDALIVAAGTTMALILAGRALRASRLPIKAKALMALAWLILIAACAAVASWWQR